MTGAVLDRIIAQGVFAVIRCRASLAILLEVGDALAATPLPVVAITPGSREPWTAISELRLRFGDNMLVGAGPLADRAQVAAALAAGAQFILSSGYRGEERLACAAAALYVPRITDRTELARARADGCAAVLACPAARPAMRMLVAATAGDPGLRWLALGGVTLENAGEIARGGADAVGLSGVLPDAIRLDMAAMIRQLRRGVQALRSVRE